MTNCIRYEGQTALDWANQRRDAYWMVAQYEGSTRILVLSCWEETLRQRGVLVLREVQGVNLIGHIGRATFTLETKLLEDPAGLAEQNPGQKITQVIHIASDDHHSEVTCGSFSLYEVIEPSEGADVHDA